jgi:hypothetical protein
MAICLQKRLLMHILRILLVAEHVQCKSQHTAVVTSHQGVERLSITLLRRTNQLVIFGALLLAGLHLLCGEL